MLLSALLSALGTTILVSRSCVCPLSPWATWFSRGPSRRLACITVVMPQRHSRATTFSKREPFEVSPLTMLDQPWPRARIWSGAAASNMFCNSSYTDATKRRVDSDAVRPFQLFHSLLGKPCELLSPGMTWPAQAPEHTRQSGRKHAQTTCWGPTAFMPAGPAGSSGSVSLLADSWDLSSSSSPESPPPTCGACGKHLWHNGKNMHRPLRTMYRFLGHKQAPPSLESPNVECCATLRARHKIANDRNHKQTKQLPTKNASKAINLPRTNDCPHRWLRQWKSH